MASRGLGSLTLDLVLKMGGFEAGMDRAARVTDKRMKEIEARAYKLGRALGTALKAGVGIAAAGLALYVKNTIEAEKVQAQLIARIKDTGSAAGRSLQQLNAQAEKLQSITIFDDEAIGSAQAMLLTFKQIQGVNFDAAVEGALDLSTAMGTDLNSAALQLGKALNDPIKGLGALSRAGIQFSKDQREMIKTMVEAGDVAGAQRVILAELQGQMGTAAEAARNTLGGAMQGLKNAFNNLLEGDASGGGLKATTQAINDLTGTLNDPQVKSGVDNIVSGIARIIATTIEGISVLERFSQNVGNIFSISKKVASGAPTSAFTDRELEIQTANLSRQKSAARKAGDQAEVDRLQTELTKLIRENTKRLKSEPTVIGELFRGKVFTGPIPAGLTTPPAQPRTTTGRTGSGRAVRRDTSLEDAARDAEKARQELKRLAEQEAQAREAFEAMAASLAGPLADANYQFIKDQERLNQLAKDGAIGAKELETAQTNLRIAHEKNVEAINAQLTPSQEVIAGLREEIELIGLSDIAQQKLIATKQAGKEATEEEIAEIERLIDAREQANKAADLQREVEAGLADAIYDVASGAKSAGDAIKDFFDDLAKYILRMIAENWAKQIAGLFSGQTGASASGGASGTNWISLIAGLFGGGKATGGWTQSWGINEVNERGFEMATVGGKDYMLTGSQPVRITPNDQLQGGGGVVQNISFNVAGRVSDETRTQAAAKIAYATQRATVRNS